MPRRGTPPLDADMLQGTLDILVLQTVAIGPAHGHTIATSISVAVSLWLAYVSRLT